MPSTRARSWLPVAGPAMLFALVPPGLAATEALQIQIVAAAVAAVVATGGVALARLGWPRRRPSDVHHLLAAFGFFLLCAGVVGHACRASEAAQW